MTLKEYQKKLALLDGEYRHKFNELRSEYAQSTAKAKIGDTISNGKTRIIVDKVELSFFTSSEPELEYSGFVLKDDTTTKRRTIILNHEIQ